MNFYLLCAPCCDIERGRAGTRLTADVWRLGNQPPARFAEGLRTMIESLTELSAAHHPADGHESNPRQSAIGCYYEMVGTLILSWAVSNKDQVFADEMLSAGRDMLLDTFVRTPENAGCIE